MSNGGDGPVLPQFYKQQRGGAASVDTMLFSPRRRRRRSFGGGRRGGGWKAAMVVIICVSVAGMATLGVIRTTRHRRQHHGHEQSATHDEIVISPAAAEVAGQDHQEANKVPNEKSPSAADGAAGQQINRGIGEAQNEKKEPVVLPSARQRRQQQQQKISITREKVPCPDGSTGYLNDDYCDCSDGSDESMTSACSHLLVERKTFPCKTDKTAQGTTLRIFSSRVNDGIVDCPDGSDEFKMGATAGAGDLLLAGQKQQQIVNNPILDTINRIKQ